MSALYRDPDYADDLRELDVDEDVRREVIDERRRARLARHWCQDCHGHTGPGSPCYVDPEDDEQGEEA